MAEGADKDSKTEEATEKRREDALDEGSTPLSRELTHLGFVFALIASGAWISLGVSSQLAEMLSAFFDRPHQFQLENAADVSMLLRALAGEIAPLLAPFVLLLILTGVFSHALQVPTRISWKRIEPKSSRISPSAGWKRIVSTVGLVELLKGTAKLGFLGFVGAAFLIGADAHVARSIDVPARNLPALMMTACVFVLLPVCAGVSILAVGDVLFSRFSWQRKIRMTRQEVRDEAKQSEGDQPQMQRRRSIARSRLRQMAIQKVPRATVVIANPTHFAVALRYVRSEGGAPVVVAKGQDLLALQIRRIAAQNGIPVVEDRSLARSLYSAVEVNEAIPREFFAAVAKILLTLRKLGNRQIIHSLEP